MALREDFEKLGNFLFRWRSYVPLVMVGLFLLALKDYSYPLNNSAFDEVWEMISLCVSLFGLGIRVYTIGHTPKGTSGRNTKQQVAEYLNTTGIYSLIRHPLYVGNFFIWFGICLFLHELWFCATSSIIFWIYYEKIMFAEEEFLRRKYGDSFLKWANKTPLIIPNFKNWVSPNLPFSLKTIIKREYSSLFAIIVAFTVMELLSDLTAQGKIKFDLLWIIIFSIGLASYATIRFIRKKTTLLKTDNR